MNDTNDKTQSIQTGEIEIQDELSYRDLKGFWGLVISILAISLSAFTLYTAGFGVLPAKIQRATHLAFVLPLIFLLYPLTKSGLKSKKVPVWDILLAIIGSGCFIYHVVNYMPLIERAGMANGMDIIMGALSIVLLLEALRRTTGWALVLVVGGFLLYAFFGHFLPGFAGHPQLSYDMVVEHVYIAQEGILGIPIGVCATFLFMFILFGAFMEKSGLGKLFIDLALGTTGHRVGGPAKVAVLGSGLFGMISGSSVANAVTTGNFVIPLMRRVGYTNDFAAAVVASASTGGQIMPPIMGAAAFIMAEMTGISYVKIALAAVLPAVLFYFGILVIVHLQSCKRGLKGIPKEELPSVMGTLKARGYLLIPIVAIVWLLLAGYTPTRSALVAIAMTILLGMFRKETRLSPRDFAVALEKGGRSVLSVAAACAGAGIIVGCVTLTGVGLKVANGIVMLSGGNLLLILIFTMVASILLGMGLPTTPKYIILAIMAVPAMVQQNVPVLAAHLFVLYFGILADVTPPVALAAYASAGIANSDPVKTGIKAFLLSLAGFIVPYLFIYHPSLVLIDSNIINTAVIFSTTMLGIVGLGAVATGYFYKDLSFVEKMVFLIASFCLIYPGIITDIAGGILLVGSMVTLKRRSVKAVVVESESY